MRKALKTSLLQTQERKEVKTILLKDLAFASSLLLTNTTITQNLGHFHIEWLRKHRYLKEGNSKCVCVCVYVCVFLP